MIDVTVPVRTGMPVYPGDPQTRVEHVATVAADGANVSRLEMCAHAGTHVDAPAHFLDGAGGVETLPLSALVGPAWVVDADGDEGAVDLDRIELPAGVERLLLRTLPDAVWTERPIAEGHRWLDEAGARALVEGDVRLVGIDRISIAAIDEPAPVHRVLLESGVVIVEGLDLRRASAGAWDLICLPLLLEGADGAPARVLLMPPGARIAAGTVDRDGEALDGGL